MSEYKPITGELRNSMTYDITTAPDGVSTASIDTSVFCALCDAIDSVHAALEAENESLRDSDGWVELPKDADGVPIHIGDVLERGERHGEVIALMLSDNPWGDGNHWAIQLEGEHAPTVFDSLFHRYVPDTWERIIEDAIRGDGGSYGCLEERFDAMVPALVARCKALAGDAE